MHGEDFLATSEEQFGVQWETALRHHVPLDRLSRVSSYDALGSLVFIPVGYALGGVIAGYAGISATIWGSTALVLVTTGLALLSHDVRWLPRGAPAPVAAQPAPPSSI